MKNKLLVFLKKNLIYIIAIVGLLVIGGLFLFFSNEAVDKVTTYDSEVKEEIYFYLAEQKFEYNSVFTFDKNKEIIELYMGDDKHVFMSEPIFYKDEVKTLFTSDMSVVHVRDNYIQKKINKFTNVYLDTDYYLESGTLDYKLGEVFFFDGEGMYFFLDTTRVEFGDEVFTLPAFSYIIYNYNKELYVYDYGVDSIKYFKNVDEDVIASNDSYTINCTNDEILYSGGSKLLVKNLDYLQKLK